MLESIVGLLGGAFGGGIVGVLGGLVQRLLDYMTKKLECDAAAARYAHEVEMRKADAEIMAQEWAARTKLAAVETPGNVAEARAFSASFNEPARYSEGVAATPAQGWLLVLLDFVRGMVRPCLTVYLCFVTTLVYLQARGLVGAPGLSQEKATDLLEKIVDTVLYLTIACVLWWFGSRVKTAQPAVVSKFGGDNGATS